MTLNQSTMSASALMSKFCIYQYEEGSVSVSPYLCPPEPSAFFSAFRNET